MEFGQLSNRRLSRFNLSSTSQQCGEYLLGDQTIWWVFNDAGNTHSETGSRYNIGVEIQAQAFGFNTNDEINNMTFINTKSLTEPRQLCIRLILVPG